MRTKVSILKPPAPEKPKLFTLKDIAVIPGVFDVEANTTYKVIVLTPGIMFAVNMVTHDCISMVTHDWDRDRFTLSKDKIVLTFSN